MFVYLTHSRRRSLSQNYQKLPVNSAPPTDPVGFGRPIHRYSPTTSLCLERNSTSAGPRLKVDKQLRITRAELRILKDVWAKRSPFYDAAMLCAAVCTVFFGFMRAGEFTMISVAAFDASVHLAPQDVSIDSTCHSVCGAHSPKAIENRPVPSRCKHLFGSIETRNLPSGCSAELHGAPMQRARSLISLRRWHVTLAQ